MPYETKLGSGALFPLRPEDIERAKERGAKSIPSLNGDAVCPVCATALWISAWSNTSKAGRKYLGLTLRPKEQKEPTTNPETGDDLPF